MKFCLLKICLLAVARTTAFDGRLLFKLSNNMMCAQLLKNADGWHRRSQHETRRFFLLLVEFFFFFFLYLHVIISYAHNK